MEGIALAKKQGVYKGRRRTLSSDQIEELERHVGNGEKKTQIAKDLGLSRVTVYQYLQKSELISTQ